MRIAVLTLAFLGSLVVVGVAGSSADSKSDSNVAFRVVDVYVDADSPVAAYQIEVKAEDGEAVVVGVEGGEQPLDAPPYYDPAALQGGRIILAAFDTDRALPAGRHRIATLHVRETGTNVRYSVVLQAAADSAGERHMPDVSVERRPEVKR